MRFKYSFIYGSLFYAVLLCTFDLVVCLTGHVCTRQKAETYEKTYDRAFICPERYTTACGQLDWRRCTKYRVNTCYTPTQKYAIRYNTVEECCPGWQDAGAGECTIPVCIGGCDNGGHCGVTSDSIPGCICPSNTYGNRCQYEKRDIGRMVIFAVMVLAIFTALAVTLHIYCRRLHTRSNIKKIIHLHKMNVTECEQLLSETSTQDNEEVLSGNEHGEIPTAPLKE